MTKFIAQTTLSTTPLASIKTFSFVGIVVIGVLYSLSGLAQASTVISDSKAFPVCMDFGCKQKQFVTISQEDWLSVANWFSEAATTAEQERDNIRRAIGWMEVVVGRYTPTHRDVGGNLLKDGETPFPGQLDCIDESINTTTYLRLFEKADLLRFHKVVDRAFRRSLFDQHWAGQLEETGQEKKRWVVDSWFQNNGDLPYIQLAEKWETIPLITSYLDSSQPDNDDEKKTSFWRRLIRN